MTAPEKTGPPKKPSAKSKTEPAKDGATPEEEAVQMSEPVVTPPKGLDVEF